MARGGVVTRLGPAAQRVYEVLRDRIRAGDLAVGDRLPSQKELAVGMGVATMTLRLAIERLGDEGLVSSEHGRGTFVREQQGAAVLVVDDDPAMHVILGRQIAELGCRVCTAASPAEGLRALHADDAVALVIADVRMPAAADGLGFIRTVRRRWPAIPLAAVTGYPDDLSPLVGTPEFPVLVLPKPFRHEQVAEALGMALGRGAAGRGG